MTRRLKLILLLLTTVSLSPLWSFSYGARFNLGLSSGTGSEWYKTLSKAGDIGFNRPVATFGIGGFAELELKDNFLFTPELYFVMNRGADMVDDYDNYIRTRIPFALELLLPLAHNIEFDSGKKAFRVLAGIQCLYSFNLTQSIRMNGVERNISDLETLSPVSLGFVFGSGLEFRKQKRIVWLLDMRLIIPGSTRLIYALPDGSKNRFNTLEFLMGSGIKF